MKIRIDFGKPTSQLDISGFNTMIRSEIETRLKKKVKNAPSTCLYKTIEMSYRVSSYLGFIFYIVFLHRMTKMVDNTHVNFIVVYRLTGKNIGRFHKLKNNVDSHTIIVHRK